MGSEPNEQCSPVSFTAISDETLERVARELAEKPDVELLKYLGTIRIHEVRERAPKLLRFCEKFLAYREYYGHEMTASLWLRAGIIAAAYLLNAEENTRTTALLDRNW